MSSKFSRCFAHFSRVSSVGMFRSSFNPAVRTTSLYIHRAKLSTEHPSFVNVVKEDGYGIVEMNRKPVNSLNLEMFTELANVIEDLEADPSCKGMILTSVHSRLKTVQFGVLRPVQTDPRMLAEHHATIFK